MNIDLPPQPERAVLPSLCIPPTPVHPPLVPAGSPTQQGVDSGFKALGPDSEFRKTVLTLETLREKAPTGISCTDEGHFGVGTPIRGDLGKFSCLPYRSNILTSFPHPRPTLNS